MVFIYLKSWGENGGREIYIQQICDIFSVEWVYVLTVWPHYIQMVFINILLSWQWDNPAHLWYLTIKYAFYNCNNEPKPELVGKSP